MLLSFQYFCWNRLYVETLSSRGMWCDAALRMMARKIFFFPFRLLVGNRLFLSLSSIYLPYRSQFAFFRLILKLWCIGLIVTYICKLMKIGRWSEHRFVFVCQLVEVIREDYVNETSGELGFAFPGNLVGESQLRIPNPDTMLSNIVHLESFELEYHAEW